MYPYKVHLHFLSRFTVEPYVFGQIENGRTSLRRITGQRYLNMRCDYAVPLLQEHIIFMQDGAP